MCFDSSSLSSNPTTTTNIKKDVVVGNDSQVFNAADGASLNVTMTDGGAFDVVKNSNALNAENYSALLSTTSSALKDLIGAQNSGLAGILNGIASTQNFIAGTQAQQSGGLDNRAKMILGLAALGVLGLFAWGRA